MILRYTFEIEHEKMVDRYYSCEDIEPDYEMVKEDVEYEYSVEPDYDDYWEFLSEKIPHTSGWDKRQWESAERTFRMVWDEDLFGNLEELEDDDDFVQFMTDRYEDDARSECEEEYGE